MFSPTYTENGWGRHILNNTRSHTRVLTLTHKVKVNLSQNIRTLCNQMYSIWYRQGQRKKREGGEKDGMKTEKRAALC